MVAGQPLAVLTLLDVAGYLVYCGVSGTELHTGAWETCFEGVSEGGSGGECLWASPKGMAKGGLGGGAGCQASEFP